MTRVKTFLVLIASGLVLGACHSSDGGGITSPDQTITYQVTSQNLTRGQPFSPGIIATHSPQATVWEEGVLPSPLIVTIAEDGFPPRS